jgi:hypothetical protein
MVKISRLARPKTWSEATGGHRALRYGFESTRLGAPSNATS